MKKVSVKGRTAAEPETRKAVYNRIQQIIYDESPEIVLFHKNLVSAVFDHVSHYRIHPAAKYLVTPQLGRQ